jgi:1,4-alpha-glucan branching enzyme
VVSPYDWSDVAQLDNKSPKLRQYMTDLYGHWIKEYIIDGYRMDVAWNVPVDFWEALRPKLEAVKQDIMLLAEAHQANLIPKAFDSDYSWPLSHAAAAVIQEGKSASTVREAWETERATYPKGAIHMRLPDSHDERRAITRFGEKGALAMHALMLTLDGLPLLYRGNEVGDPIESGAPALFEKIPVFWEMKDRLPGVAEFFKVMMPLRAQSAALRRGDLQWINNADPERVLTFLRTAPNDTVPAVARWGGRQLRSMGGAIGSSGAEVRETET